MGRHAKWLRSLAILAAIAAMGRDCAAQPEKPPASRPGDRAASDAPSEVECREFVRSVFEAVAAQDLVAFNRLIDWETIFKTAVAGLDIPEKECSEIFAGMDKKIEDPTRGFGAKFLKVAKDGGKLCALRVRQNHGRRVILFRMILPTDLRGGVNYYEFAPRRYPGGQVRASDIYLYASGEFVSETFRRIFLPLAAARSPLSRGKLTAEDRDFVHDLPEVGRAGALAAQGKAAEALAIFKTLRPGTRKHKMVLLGHLTMAQLVGDNKQCAEVIEEFRKLFPNDACFDTISIDGLLMRKDFDGAMEAIERLDQAVGGDAYLDNRRGRLCESRGDLEGARRFYLRAVEREPRLLAPHWSLVGCALRARDYPETLERLKEIDRRFAVVFGDMTQVRLYAGFVQSPQYGEWLDYLESKNRTRKNLEALATPEKVKRGSP
jgi:hypothetical protein